MPIFRQDLWTIYKKDFDKGVTTLLNIEACIDKKTKKFIFVDLWEEKISLKCVSDDVNIVNELCKQAIEQLYPENEDEHEEDFRISTAHIPLKLIL